jgi:hypothetical protein
MGLRAVLLALVLAATAAFVVGVAVERASGEAGHHDTASPVAPGKGAAAGAAHAESGGESQAAHAAEGAAGAPTGTRAAETHAELRPLGINIEAWPFVIAAVLASLALAAAAWVRPQTPELLAVVALAMLAFAALDIREVAHQLDVDKDGVAVLADAVAALHLAAALVAAAMASRAWRRHDGAPGLAGTMGA